MATALLFEKLIQAECRAGNGSKCLNRKAGGGTVDMEMCYVSVAFLKVDPRVVEGKYLAPDGGPPGARLNRYRGRYGEAESRYGPKPNVPQAVAAYCRLAAEAGMSPTQLALRFVLSRPLVACAVIGATSAEQLRELLAAAAAPAPGGGGGEAGEEDRLRAVKKEKKKARSKKG
ncbi:hypothetical protein TSOC_008013 [Tetrabaena socialis]|uniref:NADP-dependent oxidoreductase domain-containing protein n=1 Tax=Tetrabaena socialis TaxID=47790 RepID=A0A2J7ZZL5_9CHLO|nr:hypothetical protein TSOC_008013 [Tetrabaena socialis]|eukprot:PNH05711.1 hypothetical protein TSOC_008013 [Tetrabaena socialis]